MRLRRFEGASVAEALARVKADLGPEAVILHARATGPGEAAGAGRIQVTAAVDGEPAASDWRARGNGHEHQPAGHFESARQAGAAWGECQEGGVPPATGAAASSPSSDSAGDGALEDIRAMLHDLQAEASPSVKLPKAMRPLYRRLVAQEVPGAVARRLLLALPSEVQAGRGSPDRAVLHEVAARQFRVSGPIVTGRQQRAVALVGPTGVGKTTTIAKLAGHLRYAAGLTVALLTLDTYRIGGVAQMGIYARLLGLPLHVVRTPAEIGAALATEQDADVVLVDTMGRSPQEPEGIAATRSLLRHIPGLEVHLVVSATTKGKDLQDILRRFRPLQYRRLAVTKVDEVRTLGPVLGLALQRRLAVSYLATGQEVPDDLEAATPWRLASLLVPEELAVGWERPRRTIRAGQRTA